MAVNVTPQTTVQKTDDFLRAIAPFAGLDASDLQAVARLLGRRDFGAGEYVFTERDIGRNLFIVEEGLLSLIISGRPVKQFRRGDFFGEVALIDESLRTGSVRVERNASLLLLAGSDLDGRAGLPPACALVIIRNLARQVVGYLRNTEQTSTRELINMGESERVEFKSSLRYNMHTGKPDRAIEHAALKSIAAFLNGAGGTLIIGVQDNGTLCGLEHDNFPNEDRAMLHLTNLVKERIGAQHMSYLHSSVEELDGKRVLRVDCKAAGMPAYLGYAGNEYFFVRTGPATTDLRLSEVHGYILRRFGERGVPDS